MSLKYFSMFSGIGGFEKAIGDKGKCVGYSEIDPDAIEIFNKKFKGLKNYGNANSIKPRDIPDFELLVAGFPCQAFSIAGNRAGFDETRGTLFFDIARIVKEKRPKYLLLENVKGLLSHDNGRTIKTILATLNELDYDTEVMVLDGKFFQSGQRSRVFIYSSYRNSVIDYGQGHNKTAPIYPNIWQRTRAKDLPCQETSRTSGRIIRTFTRLPDWLDSWETFYSPEALNGELSTTKSS